MPSATTNQVSTSPAHSPMCRVILVRDGERLEPGADAGEKDCRKQEVQLCQKVMGPDHRAGPVGEAAGWAETVPGLAPAGIAFVLIAEKK
jgi:hypothetical protein